MGFQITHDDAIETVTIIYSAQILPVFIRYERTDSLDLKLENVHPDEVRQWCEQKLLGFLDSYLEIETHEQYQYDNVAIDPVCGTRVVKPVGLAHEYDGQTYFFCAQRCLEKFADRPSEFVHVAAR